MSNLFSLLIAAALSTTAMAASISEFNTRFWQTEEGLPHNNVRSITQTRDGYLWVGTREGLARFDGIKFTPFKLSPAAPQPAITALCGDRDGALWIGTAGAGLFRLQNGSLTHHGTGSLANMGVVQITQSRDGVVWIAYRDGLANWQAGNLHFPVDPEITTNLMSSCADHAGGVWIGATRGIQHWKDSQVATYKAANSLALRAIRGLHEDADGTLWLGGNRGLTRMKDGVFTHYSKGNGPSGIVTALWRDRGNNLWVGTQGGLSRFVDGAFHEIQEPGGATYGIYALFEDREGSLWVGSEAGLARLTPKPFVNYNKQTGLTQNATTSVCAARDGSIWVGTWGGGLNCLNNGVVSTYARSNGLASDFVVAILEARDASLWVGTAYAPGTATPYAPGLNRIRGGRVTEEKAAAARIGSVITALLEDQQDNLWIGSHNGLFRFRQGASLVDTGFNELSNQVINALCESRGGNLWIGTDGGLRRWDGQHLGTAPIAKGEYKIPVFSLYEDHEGVLWIGTLGEGLGRLANNVFTAYSSRQGLWDDSIYAIMEDESHNLWFNSGRGTFRVAKNEFAELARGGTTSLNCIGYGKADGVLGNGQTPDITQPAACQDAQGQLWFRTTQGVVAIDPNKIIRNELPPPVIIENIIADRKPVSSSLFAREKNSSTGATVGDPMMLDLPPGQGELEIQFTALSLQASEKNRFKYKLAGADRDWVEADGRRAAYYNRLAPGTYSFQVIACNNEGVWNQAGASMGLILRPHLWQTWWFLSSSSLLAACFIGVATRQATRRRLQRKLERLEQQHAIEKERARIARDMHDELGAKLTRISFQGATALRSLEDRSEAERQVGSMAETARELVASLDEIVWAVDPGNDSLENLANYICRCAGNLCQNSPLTCDLSIPAKLPDHRLPTDVRHNLFLAFKEALNNALKHSGGTQVRISLAVKTDEFEVNITDDGHGFDAAALGKSPMDKTQRTGRGLIHLRERLAAIGGRCELASQPGRGTSVRFVVPLKAKPS